MPRPKSTYWNRSAAYPSPVIHLRINHEDLAEGTEICPSCGQPVKRKTPDSPLRSHRVGKGAQAWPCPGENAAVRR